MTQDITGRYPTIATMPPDLIDMYLSAECECRPDLPDGRSFEMCLPCKVRQDVERYEEDLRISLFDLEPTEDDIPFLF